MKKSRFKPSLEETFSVGKLEGERQAFEEILTLIKDGLEVKTLNSYLKARLKSLMTKNINNPFK